MAARVGLERVHDLEVGQLNEMYRLFSMQVLPALILLNCRNAVDTELVAAPDKLNRKRAKKGKAPIPEHNIVKVHLSQARRRAYEARGGSANAARGGLVMGHFKVRKSGIYWWSPHWRGSPSDHVQDRTYVLTR